MKKNMMKKEHDFQKKMILKFLHKMIKNDFKILT